MPAYGEVTAVGQHRTAPAWVRRRSSTAEQADAAEVVVAGLPGPNVVARVRERVEGFRLEAGLRVHQLADRVETRPVDGGLRRGAPRRGSAIDWTSALRIRVPPADPPARTDPVAVERRGGRHHARHAGSRLERADERVRLPEHAVQVHLKARENRPIRARGWS